MFQIGEYVIYKKEVCKISDIKEKYVKDDDYYILNPIDDISLTVKVPTSNRFHLIRSLISKGEVEEIISKIPEIQVLDLQEKLIENEYRKLLNSNRHEDLICIIKTTYLRNRKRSEENKKISDRDQSYFEKAERFLYGEFSAVLDMDYEETKEYVIEKVNELETNS